MIFVSCFVDVDYLGDQSPYIFPLPSHIFPLFRMPTYLRCLLLSLNLRRYFHVLPARPLFHRVPNAPSRCAQGAYLGTYREHPLPPPSPMFHPFPRIICTTRYVQRNLSPFCTNHRLLIRSSYAVVPQSLSPNIRLHPILCPKNRQTSRLGWDRISSR